MPIKFGTTSISSIYKGDTKIDKIYKGLDLVYQSSLLPSGYTECEYLESDGNQYITFNILLPKDAIMEFKSSVSKSGSYQTILGNIGSGNKIEIYYTNTKVYVWSSPAKLINLESDVGDNSYNAIHKTTVLLLKDNIGKKQLFAYNGDYKLTGRIYSAKMHDADNNLLFNFVPALDENDKPCMYDTVSGNTFYNQGTGEFNYG